MLVEMLGMVCHSEFYNEDDQMVEFLREILITLRISSFISRASTLQCFGQLSLPIIFIRFTILESTNCWQAFGSNCHIEPYSLLDNLEHATFLKHFISLIRYLAAGHGNV